MSRVRLLNTSRTTAFVVLGGGAAASLYPRRTAFAEAPNQDDIPYKKPIYSDLPPTKPTSTTPKPSRTSPDPAAANPANPTPTDRLTAQIKRVRVFLHSQTERAEDGINDGLTWAFKKETNLANTIASLAPAPETGEKLLPGAIYVLVATMAGSIVSRNRNILIRATFPLAVGVTAGWMLIPVTMRNTADLIWEYEKKVPIISETHAQIGGFAREAWRQIKYRGKAVGEWADETAGVSRDKVEKWVEQGK